MHIARVFSSSLLWFLACVRARVIVHHHHHSPFIKPIQFIILPLWFCKYFFGILNLYKSLFPSLTDNMTNRCIIVIFRLSLHRDTIGPIWDLSGLFSTFLIYGIKSLFEHLDGCLKKFESNQCSLNIVFFLKMLWFFWTLQVLLQRWCLTWHCVHTLTPRGNRERGQSPEYILKSWKKHNI